jgi:hypothetical protein
MPYTVLSVYIVLKMLILQILLNFKNHANIQNYILQKPDSICKDLVHSFRCLSHLLSFKSIFDIYICWPTIFMDNVNKCRNTVQILFLREATLVTFVPFILVVNLPDDFIWCAPYFEKYQPFQSTDAYTWEKKPAGQWQYSLFEFPLCRANVFIATIWKSFAI